jgi:hypothetical protein
MINYKFTDGENKCTTAYILACCKIIPPDYFNHDPLIKDENCGRTIAMTLSWEGILPL